MGATHSGCCQAAGRPDDELVQAPILRALDDGVRVPRTAKEALKELEQRYDEVLQLRLGAKLPDGWVPTLQLVTAVLANSKVAPMRLLPFATLRGALQSGTMGLLSHRGSTVPAPDLPSGARVLFLSHRWWSSARGEPDRVDRGWPKARAIAEIMVPMLANRFDCRPEEIFIWWDYFCVDQQDPAIRLHQLECIPLFVAMSDVVVACRAGDEVYHSASGSGELEPGLVADLRDHPGHYNNRVWTMCELFMATSDFQRRMRGERMPVYSFEFDADMRVIRGPLDQTAVLRSQFHETDSWSLPPRENLVNPADLDTLEPLLVMLGTQDMPRIVKAAKFGLRVALDIFLSNGDANVVDPASGEQALHSAARIADRYMLTRLLTDSLGVNVNAQTKAGRTPLHLLVSAGVFDHRCDPDKRRSCARLLVDARADPKVRDARGRSALDVAVGRFGPEEAARLFPSHREELCITQDMSRLPSFKLAFRPGLLGTSGIEFTTGQRKFHDGSVVHWRRMAPVRRANGRQPELVVCFPTGVASAWFYVEWAYRLALSQGHEVIMVDNPGSGRSAFRPNVVKNLNEAKALFAGMATTEEIMAEYLRDIVSTFELEGWGQRGAHLVGTSVGCVMAAYLALTRPEWCRSLALFGWVHSYRHSPEARQCVQTMVQTLTDQYLAGDVAGFESAIGQFLGASTDPSLRELFLHATRPGGDNARDNGAMNMLSLVIYASLQNVLELSSLKAPTMVILGEADSMFMDHGLAFARLVPHSLLSILPRVGHIAPAENPVDSHDIIVEFLTTALN